jgi:hypothetical protein
VMWTFRNRCLYLLVGLGTLIILISAYLLLCPEAVQCNAGMFWVESSMIMPVLQPNSTCGSIFPPYGLQIDIRLTRRLAHLGHSQYTPLTILA